MAEISVGAIEKAFREALQNQVDLETRLSELTTTRASKLRIVRATYDLEEARETVGRLVALLVRVREDFQKGGVNHEFRNT